MKKLGANGHDNKHKHTYLLKERGFQVGSKSKSQWHSEYKRHLKWIVSKCWKRDRQIILGKGKQSEINNQK